MSLMAVVGCSSSASAPAATPSFSAPSEPAARAQPDAGARSPEAIPSASSGGRPSDAPPFVVQFVDVDGSKTLEPKSDHYVIAAIDGRIEIDGKDLGAGDIAESSCPRGLAIAGKGTAVVAALPTRLDCSRVRSKPNALRIVRSTEAPDLAWAGGTMHAHLDAFVDSGALRLYAGRLEGTAAVQEHSHPGSWEILCAARAAGTFALNGVEKRLGDRQCVAVPPDTKHSWKPDAGSKLVGIQFYSPPGPEQRFKALAAKEGAVSK